MNNIMSMEEAIAEIASAAMLFTLFAGSLILFIACLGIL